VFSTAFSLLDKPEMLLLVGAPHRIELLSQALKRHGVRTEFKTFGEVLIRGLHTLIGHLGLADPASGRALDQAKICQA